MREKIGFNPRPPQVHQIWPLNIFFLKLKVTLKFVKFTRDLKNSQRQKKFFFCLVENFKLLNKG